MVGQVPGVGARQAERDQVTHPQAGDLGRRGGARPWACRAARRGWLSRSGRGPALARWMTVKGWLRAPGRPGCAGGGFTGSTRAAAVGPLDVQATVTYQPS